MKASLFYQTKAKGAIPLCLMGEDEHGFTTLAEKSTLSAQSFKGRVGEVGFIFDKEGALSKIFVGFGDKSSDALAIATILNRLPEGCYRVDALSYFAKLSWSLSQYQFDKYKPQENGPRELLVLKEELPEILAEADAIFFVRNLINTPTNHLGPKELAETLERMALKFGATFQAWEGQVLAEQFPAIDAVGRAAEHAPRLVSLIWGDEGHPKVTLVGKGVCFDSGGLDVKPGSGMRLMKKDMAGAAHVMGLAQWMMTLQIPIRLQVLIPAVENAVDAKSYRPGDVLIMRNKMSVEVHNTDAEGRLVLADALVKAAEAHPELIIDFSTLTGAARVAVGTEISAFFTNDDELARQLMLFSEKTNDPIWRLPLFAAYEELLGSTIATISNATDAPYGGAITAALFLKRFVPDDISWAHFDIMAWNVAAKPGKPEGGEAMGLRAVFHYLRQRYAKALSSRCA